MKMLRNIILGALLTVSSVASADSYAYLTVAQTSGEASFAVSNISKITFDETNMVLHLNDGSQQTLPLTSLSKMFFSENATNGIMTANAQQSQITMKEGVLRVSAPQGSLISIYDTGGKAVRTVTAERAETEVNVSGLTKGVYIIKVGNQTKKIMNK